LTINQRIPINGKASVSVSLDISDISQSIDDIIIDLKKIYGVSTIKLLSIE